jgi:hypothetical protein
MAGHVLYSVQILIPFDIPLDPDELHRRLLAWRGDIIRSTGTLDRIGLEIPTHPRAGSGAADSEGAGARDRARPLLVQIFRAPTHAYASRLNEALAWSPAWPGCRDALMECTASIVVAMAPYREVNHATLLLAFLMVLDTVLLWIPEVMREQAVLFWMPAQQVLPIERYRALRTELGPCGPAVNVRIGGSGRPGELIADTLGLAELGLPDLQTVSRDDPERVSGQLLLAAQRVFVGDRLDCEWAFDTARIPPVREALTLSLFDFEHDVTPIPR